MADCRKERGLKSEKKAATFLQKNGYQIVTSNFKRKCGEIDLIALKNNCYIFVEVKSRKNSSFAGPASNLSLAQIKRIKKTAQLYLQEQRLNEFSTDIRFDLLCFSGQQEEVVIDHFKDAF